MLDRLTLAMGELSSGLLEAADRLVCAVAEIEASGEVDAASRALALLAGRPRLLIRLDGLARSGNDPDVYVSVVDELAGRLTTGSAGPLAVAFASTHRDGHIREAAVRRMIQQPSAGLVPFLVLRTTDWVGQVREQAGAGLAVVLHGDPATHIPLAVGMSVLMERRVRGSFAGAQLLVVVVSAPQLIGGLMASPDHRVRRVALDANAVSRRLRLDELSGFAEADPDRQVRLRAAETAVREALWTARRQVMHDLAASRHAEVRAVAATGLMRAGLVTEVAALVTDAGSLVRAIARDAARSIGVDPLEQYRDALAADVPALGAIDGLAETGTELDQAVLLSLVDHPRPKIRAHAIRALSRVGLDVVCAQRLVPLLRDSSPVVVREAAAALDTARLTPTAELLWALLAERDRAAVRRAGYRLLRRGDTGTALRAALLVITDPDSRLAARAHADITRIVGEARRPWRHGRVAATLDASHLDELRALAAPAASALGESTASRLTHILDRNF